MRRHVWLAWKPDGTKGRLPISIVFGDLEPFPPESEYRKPVPITQPMIGWLMGRCHTAIGRALLKPLPAGWLEAAEAYLAEVYGPGRTIVEATFRERRRIRDW
ncbi:MAG: hypothetical protein QUV05_21980 [Phycisphaerae bacterium]|nr:hypothetical protein [Phycisphaerae bacterium]